MCFDDMKAVIGEEITQKELADAKKNQGIKTDPAYDKLPKRCKRHIFYNPTKKLKYEVKNNIRI